MKKKIKLNLGKEIISDLSSNSMANLRGGDLPYTAVKRECNADIVVEHKESKDYCIATTPELSCLNCPVLMTEGNKNCIA